MISHYVDSLLSILSCQKLFINPGHSMIALLHCIGSKVALSHQDLLPSPPHFYPSPPLSFSVSVCSPLLLIDLFLPPLLLSSPPHFSLPPPSPPLLTSSFISSCPSPPHLSLPPPSPPLLSSSYISSSPSPPLLSPSNRYEAPPVSSSPGTCHNTGDLVIQPHNTPNPLPLAPFSYPFQPAPATCLLFLLSQPNTSHVSPHPFLSLKSLFLRMFFFSTAPLKDATIFHHSTIPHSALHNPTQPHNVTTT